jgi:hypothetical protein
MNTRYFITPNHSIALNFKVASSSIARAVIAAFNPEKESLITTPHGNGNGTAYPEGKDADSIRWHSLAESEQEPTKPVMLLVREPVEKFRSACSESGVTDIDAKLTALESDWGRDAHFWSQSRLLKGAGALYVFPEHLEQFAADAGLAYPLPLIPSVPRAEKPDLTESQLARIAVIYADDVMLFNSITTAGQAFVEPPDPAIAEQEAEAQARYAAYIASIAPAAQSYAATLRTHFPDMEPPAEQNHTVTENVVFGYFDAKRRAGTITAIENADSLFLATMFGKLKTEAGNTWDLPWNDIWVV